MQLGGIQSYTIHKYPFFIILSQINKEILDILNGKDFFILINKPSAGR